MIVDRALVERLESTAATSAAELARAMAITAPQSRAVAEPLGDGALVAMGAGRYVNRALGVSLAEVAADELVERVVGFYRARDLAPSIEVCSWAPSSVLTQIGVRAFRPEWFRNVYVRRADAAVDVDVPPFEPMDVREVDETMLHRWQHVLAEGNAVHDPAARAVSDEFAAAASSVAGETPYLVEIGGEAAGCGSLRLVGGVGWVGAAATVPAFGQRGVQGVLLRHRIAIAVAAGCELVAASALPGGRSARNLERHGFVQAYAQLVMTLQA